jgi:hypothetical protein
LNWRNTLRYSALSCSFHQVALISVIL